MVGGDTEPAIREILKSKLGEVSTESKVKTTAPSWSSFIFRARPGHRSFSGRLAMETHKVGYLSSLLQRRSVGLESYVEAYMSIEQQVRSCYAEHDDSSMSSAEFGAIMVVDGLFVVELINKFMDHRLIQSNDALFKQNLNLSFGTRFVTA
ncbi:hypothetical protein F3Y22_tig00111151pilonHSYRG00249 [Hibiscus syriacus]|uniref:Uncharacterized protein n=1 Tax=Hibiscus syriacus TaxID=106335 RepID=A0A6A2YY32_HIBSY|nr:hypothetical protein F3Y22_tig00111151pilonHSYRG00249 [Hibiscus syriacus]